MMKTLIYHRKNRFNMFAMKEMLDNNMIDYEYDEFPEIRKGDWVSLSMHDDNGLKYGIVIDIIEYSPFEYVDVSMCYQDIYFVKGIDNITYECFWNNICSHVSTKKIKSIMKELKNKTKIIE